MLNLAYPIDDKAKINGTEYAVNLAFDNVLRFFDMMQDDSISDSAKVECGLIMLIDDPLRSLHDDERADVFLKLIDEFIGKEAKKQQRLDIAGNPMPSSNVSEKEYDLVQDADYIYASFMSDYNIDLIERQGILHWDKFQALLGGLTSESKLMKVIEIRNAELPKGKGTSKQREAMKKLKKQYALKR